jgi:hypothetical protein
MITLMKVQLRFSWKRQDGGMIDSQKGGNRPEPGTWLGMELGLTEVQDMEDKGWSPRDYKEQYNLMTWKKGITMFTNLRNW